jgi:transposase-like protein
VLAKLRWPDGLVCSRCEGRRFYRLRARPRVWECATCGRQQSVTAGTAMHRTKVSLQRWLVVTLVMPMGVSAHAIAVEFDVSYETAFQMLHKIRHVLADAFESRLPRLDEAPDVWQVGWSQIPTRLPWRRKPYNHAGLIAIATENGWHYAPWADERAAALANRAREVPFEARVTGVQRAARVARHLRKLHGGVSMRWFRRYLAERRAYEEGTDGDLARRLLLWTHPLPWRRIPPELPPEALDQRSFSTARASGGSDRSRSAPRSS